MAWCLARGCAPLPAAPGQVESYLAEIEAAGGSFAAWSSCAAIADAAAELGLPAPVACVAPVMESKSAIDHSIAVPWNSRGTVMAGLGPGALIAPAAMIAAAVAYDIARGKASYLPGLQGARQQVITRARRTPGRPPTARTEEEIERHRRRRRRARHRRGRVPTELTGLGAIRPMVAPLSLPEAELMLDGLIEVNMSQYLRGVPDISPALWTGQLRYIRRDTQELWKPVADIWKDGGGDCEDLAAGVAAFRTLLGQPSRVKIIRSGPGIAHAVVQDKRTGRLLDPSWTGGMGWAE